MVIGDGEGECNIAYGDVGLVDFGADRSGLHPALVVCQKPVFNQNDGKWYIAVSQGTSKRNSGTGGRCGPHDYFVWGAGEVAAAGLDANTSFDCQMSERGQGWEVITASRFRPLGNIRSAKQWERRLRAALGGWAHTFKR